MPENIAGYIRSVRIEALDIRLRYIAELYYQTSGRGQTEIYINLQISPRIGCLFTTIKPSTVQIHLSSSTTPSNPTVQRQPQPSQCTSSKLSLL